MKKLLPWLGAAIILVVIFGTIYGVTQQAQRSAANYPQIQLAEDTAAALNNNTNPPQTGYNRVDMSSSLAPFVIIYDRSGNLVSGTGFLDGRVPKAPLGMLGASRLKTYNAVTWQPRGGVRVAAVTVAAKNYYVLSGRSLTEVEKNENKTFDLALLGGVISLALLGLAFGLDRRYTSS